MNNKDEFAEIKNLLENYAPLTQEAWLKFIDQTKIKFFQKNSYLLQPGSNCNHVYFILSGSVRVFCRTENGKEISTRFVFEGQFSNSILNNNTSHINNECMVTLEDSTFLVINQRSFQELLSAYPEWEKIAHKITENDYQQKTKREHLLLEKPIDRYIKFVGSEKMLYQRIEQKHLASYLGMTPETFSRIKKKALVSANN